MGYRSLVATFRDGREVLQILKQVLILSNRQDHGFPVSVAVGDVLGMYLFGG